MNKIRNKCIVISNWSSVAKYKSVVICKYICIQLVHLLLEFWKKNRNDHTLHPLWNKTDTFLTLIFVLISPNLRLFEVFYHAIKQTYFSKLISVLFRAKENITRTPRCKTRPSEFIVIPGVFGPFIWLSIYLASEEGMLVD